MGDFVLPDDWNHFEITKTGQKQQSFFKKLQLFLLALKSSFLLSSLKTTSKHHKHHKHNKHTNTRLLCLLDKDFLFFSLKLPVRQVLLTDLTNARDVKRALPTRS